MELIRRDANIEFESTEGFSDIVCSDLSDARESIGVETIRHDIFREKHLCSIRIMIDDTDFSDRSTPSILVESLEYPQKGISIFLDSLRIAPLRTEDIREDSSIVSHTRESPSEDIEVGDRDDEVVTLRRLRRRKKISELSHFSGDRRSIDHLLITPRQSDRVSRISESCLDQGSGCALSLRSSDTDDDDITNALTDEERVERSSETIVGLEEWIFWSDR